MRSELVYRASDKVQNRFQLCQLASRSARSMNRSSVGMQLTINQAFEAIGAQSVPSIKKPPLANELGVEPANDAVIPALILDAAV